jgi:hypothetical protein
MTDGPMMWISQLRDRLESRRAAAAARIAAATSAAFPWLRRDGKPTLDVVCKIRRPCDTGDWLTVDLAVRNLDSHSLHVVALEVLRPRGARVWTDEDDRFWSMTFLAPSLGFEPRASINATLKPRGAAPDYLRLGSNQIWRSEGDALARRFWIRLPLRGAERIKMGLICELKTPVVRMLTVPIKRPIPPTERR